MKIDLNCDLGEADDPLAMDADRDMLKIVTSANVACGGHAGNSKTMFEAARMAAKHGVAIGAHPSFEDREGFGRRAMPVWTARDVEKLVADQISALQVASASAAHVVTHVKPHGALSNMSCIDFGLASAIARAIRSVDRELVFVVLPHSAMERAAQAESLSFVREIYADRAYDDNGMLVSRNMPDAVLHDPIMISQRMLRALEDRQIVSVSGKRIAMDAETICVHGDTPGAIAIASSLKESLLAQGIELASFLTSRKFA